MRFENTFSTKPWNGATTRSHLRAAAFRLPQHGIVAQKPQCVAQHNSMPGVLLSLAFSKQLRALQLSEEFTQCFVRQLSRL